MKKLVITDEVMTIIANEKSFLSRKDVELFMVPTNDDVLEIHRVENADIIITTLNLSGMKSEDLCSAIRADEALRKVSIILLCSNSAADLERSNQCNANVVVTLPVEPAVLLEKVKQLIDIPLREAYRVLVGVKFEGTDKGMAFFGRSGDLSTSGMLIETEKVLEKGNSVACSFFLPGSPQIKTNGEIVRIVKQAAPGSKSIQYGVRFLSLTVEERSAIESFIEKKSQVSTSRK
jgi:DNA-binding response OmpR family regulator